jgi:hypothetical protein
MEILSLSSFFGDRVIRIHFLSCLETQLLTVDLHKMDRIAPVLCIRSRIGSGSRRAKNDPEKYKS